MTLKEIAAELGVSYSTVSRVINNYNRNFSVRPELRKKILDKVEELHFTPDPVFSALRRRNNRQFAILLPGSVQILRNSGDQDSLYVLEKYLTAHHCYFEYLPFVDESAMNFRQPKWKAAGYILIDAIAPEQLSGVEKSNIPYVVLNGICGENGTAIQCDDYGDMTALLEYLYQMKHWRIAYMCIKLPLHDTDERKSYDFGVSDYSKRYRLHHSSIPNRNNAYINFCRAHGMPELCDYVTTPEQLQECFDHYLAAGVTAFVGYNFKSGLAIMQELHKRGLDIPRQASVISFDDTEYNNFTIPALSSLAHPALEMGKKAAQLIIRRSENNSYAKGKIFLLPGRIIERKSVCPPPHAFDETLRKRYLKHQF